MGIVVGVAIVVILVTAIVVYNRRRGRSRDLIPQLHAAQVSTPMFVNPLFPNTSPSVVLDADLYVAASADNVPHAIYRSPKPSGGAHLKKIPNVTLDADLYVADSADDVSHAIYHFLTPSEEALSTKKSSIELDAESYVAGGTVDASFSTLQSASPFKQGTPSVYDTMDQTIHGQEEMSDMNTNA